jgi:hypothetical protein
VLPPVDGSSSHGNILKTDLYIHAIERHSSLLNKFLSFNEIKFCERIFAAGIVMNNNLLQFILRSIEIVRLLETSQFKYDPITGFAALTIN